MARFLARAIAYQLVSSPRRTVRRAADAGAREVGELCRRFPDDAEMQAALAMALHVSGRDIEAVGALDSMKPQGAGPEKYIDPADVLMIRHAAGTETTTRFWRSIALAAAGTAAIWIAMMFVLGAVLAMWIPASPSQST